MVSGASVLAIVAIISQVSACPLTCNTFSDCVGNYGSGVFSSPAVVSSNCYGSEVFSAPSVVAAPSVVSSNCYGSEVFSSPSVVAGPSVVSASPAVVSSNYFGSDLASTSVQERVSPGTYQVALDNCGPSSCRSLPVIRTRATAPVQQKPTIRIPASIPAPRTVCNKCKCVKTIVKPQVIEQVVTVPSVQRYIQTTSRPVVEKIHYTAVPVNNCNGELSGLSTGYGLSDFSSDVSSGYGLSEVSGYGVSDLSGCSTDSQVLVSASPVCASAPVCASTQVCASAPVVESYPVAASGCACF